MAFWFWVVILSIVALGLYELYFWYKDKKNPPQEEIAAEEETVEAMHAELARANMKIAMLQSRLEESAAKQQEEAAALAALEQRYQEQLEKTEKAYQRQMVSLSERLAGSENGRGRRQSEHVVEYPVRMAAKVAAWRASLEGYPLVDPAVSEDLAALAEPIPETIEAQNFAEDAISEETADPKNGTSPAARDAGQVAPDPHLEIPLDLADEVVLTAGLLEPEQEVLDQVVVLDDLPDEPVTDEALAALEEDKGLPVELVVDEAPAVLEADEDLTVEAAVDEALAVREADEDLTAKAAVDEAPAVLEADEDLTVEAVGEKTPATVEEIPPLENRWPDLESLAMQRVMTRQLASEMDADYLDYEEFLREMGIEPEPTGQDGPATPESWITDPLEEMADHLNGSERPSDADPEDELESDNDQSRQRQPISDIMWEEVIFDDVEPVEDAAGDGSDDLAHVAEDGAERAAAEVVADDAELEEEVIAATVATILSRTPAGEDAYFNEDLFQQEESDPDNRDEQPLAFAALDDPGEDEDELFPNKSIEAPLVEETAVLDAAPDAEMPAETAEQREEAGEEDAPEEPEPAFVWERKPVTWQAEYFANTTLADEPVLVRQDSDIDFEWLDRAPGEGLTPRSFSVRWSGVLALDPGQYRFTASAPDGLRLWLNDRLVISAWYDQSEQTYQREFAWPGGSIDLRLEHYENGGNAKAFLIWERVV